MRKRAVLTAAGGVLAVTALLGAATMGPGTGAGGNFSQMAGFAEHFSAHPPRDGLPDKADRALLERHRPRIYLPAGHPGPISFYDDYIAQGVLKSGTGEVISDNVSPDLLNSHKDDPSVVFEHRASTPAAGVPAVFARIDRDDVAMGSDDTRKLIFLTYHAVFRHSGLAAGMLGWQILLAGLFGNLDDWHQLDHYTAVTLVLDDDDTPVALLVQQHNNQRTYLLGESYTLPDDGRPEVDVAIRSNELYPHAPGRRRHKAVRYPGMAEMKYLLGITGRPFLTADDVTDPQREAAYDLRFLPPSDAFYTFEGYLGERRILPGRSGPPGADYNTLPFLKPLGLQLLVGYWRPDNRGDAQRFLQAAKQPDWIKSMIRLQAEVFSANLACARRWGADCAFK